MARFPLKKAYVSCNGGCRNTGCSSGCIGCGKCIDVCRFGAIHISSHGVAEVDKDNCIGCSACTKACPQHVIHLYTEADLIRIRCSNHSKGPDARKLCTVSCIACGICERTCTAGAVAVEDNLASIDYELCLSCGMCAVKCPRHVIEDIRGVLTEAD